MPFGGKLVAGPGIMSTPWVAAGIALAALGISLLFMRSSVPGGPARGYQSIPKEAR